MHSGYCISYQSKHMKAFFAPVIFSLICAAARGQCDTIDHGNSCQSYLKRVNPGIKYSYNKYSQIHDYSGNWDLDGDGVPDRILFIGEGGTHLYFHLMIILSSNIDLVNNYPWLAIDVPCLGNTNDLKTSEDAHPFFVVDDFDGDGKKDIYLALDHNTWCAIPTEWKNTHGITSRQLLLKYKKGKIVISNFNTSRKN